MALASQLRLGPLRERVAWGLAVTIGAAALIFTFLLLRHGSPVPTPVRFTIATPGNGSLPLFGRPTVSPDGQSVLFAVKDPATRGPVWYLYSFMTATSKLLPGAEAAHAVFWSFDSRSILLRRTSGFWKMDLNAGSPQRLPVTGAYASWQPEGIVAGGREGLRWFRADGSGLRWIKKRDDEKSPAYSYPSLIPGRRWLMYNVAESDGFSLHFSSLDGNVDRMILKTEHPAIYAAPGYLLSRRGDTLTAQTIEPESGKLRGVAVPIAGPMGVGVDADLLGPFSVSDNGVLVFRPAQDAPNGVTVVEHWPSLLKKK